MAPKRYQTVIWKAVDEDRFRGKGVSEEWIKGVLDHVEAQKPVDEVFELFAGPLEKAVVKRKAEQGKYHKIHAKEITSR